VGWLLCMIVAMALLEMLGVASIMPFMAVLANPEIFETNVMLNVVYQAASQHLGIATTEQFLFALGMLVLVLLVVSLAFKVLTSYKRHRPSRRPWSAPPKSPICTSS